jgi:hypothetical protein
MIMTRVFFELFNCNLVLSLFVVLEVFEALGDLGSLGNGFVSLRGALSRTLVS